MLQRVIRLAASNAQEVWSCRIDRPDPCSGLGGGHGLRRGQNGLSSGSLDQGWRGPAIKP